MQNVFLKIPFGIPLISMWGVAPRQKAKMKGNENETRTASTRRRVEQSKQSEIDGSWTNDVQYFPPKERVY